MLLSDPAKRIAFSTKSLLAGRGSLRTDAEFRAAEDMTTEELAALSARRAAAHAKFAMMHSPFYRDYYSSHGFTVNDLEDPSAFGELPFLDKQLVRDHFDHIPSDESTDRSSRRSRTGGSTGLPLHVLRDVRFPARALEWRLFRWWGVEPWEDRAIITRHMLTGRARTMHDLAWLPSRRIQLDAFAITDDAVHEFLGEWDRVRPRVVVGYGGGVVDFVRRMVRLGVVVAPPRAVAVTAAPLAPGVRAEIQDGLGAPCYDHYRSAEVPWIAGECTERDGMHVFSDVRLVEIVDDDDKPSPPATDGAVIVSDLTNRVFPILRYRLGDISSVRDAACPCGRPFPRLGPVSGRSSDAVRLPDGTTIAGALGHIFDDFPYAVRQFEIVQAADYSVTLRCIPSDRAERDEGIKHAEGKLRSALRGQVPLTLERTDFIPQTGGKMRFIRSSAPAPGPEAR